MVSRIIVFLVLILASCAPVAAPIPAETLPAGTVAKTVMPLPLGTGVFVSVPTSTPTPAPAKPSPLPTQLTVVPTLNPTQEQLQNEIKEVIQAYFDLRYSLLSIAPPAAIQQDVFGELVSDGDEARDFLVTETAKLAVERKWYEMRGLRYARYQYTLEYRDIAIDAAGQTAAVSLLEKYAIVREWAVESNPESPSVTRGDTTHKIVLRNEKGQWKIISDTYRDGWWRQFRKPGMSTEEILREIEAEMRRLEAATPLP